VIIVDKALQERHAQGNPVRIGVAGAGFMGRPITRQIIANVPGMDVVAISNRTISGAERAYREAGAGDWVYARDSDGAAGVVAGGGRVVTDDPHAMCRASGIDAIVEATGQVEFGARVALDAIEHGKHVVLVNAELDATIGPMLKVHADKAGVVITDADGDEPGVAMNLFRFVNAVGYKPVMAGNIKGFIDPYRNPDTQQEFAAATGQNPRMVTSFADGTKLSMETAILANATGFGVGKRGMFGHKCAHVNDVLKLFSAEQFLSGGYVDYVLGAEPGTGAFVVAYDTDVPRKHYMKYFKMGDGPFYVFYRPWHLPHLEVPLTIARAVLFHDAAVTPLAGPTCDVVTIAKRELKTGEKLDGIGGFTCYGTIENYSVSRTDNLLPMGLSESCRVTRDIGKDEPISYEDVQLPEGRVADQLRAEQVSYFDDAQVRLEVPHAGRRVG
jgi:predicted homoserine dehydrogenase-like protein